MNNILNYITHSIVIKKMKTKVIDEDKLGALNSEVYDETVKFIQTNQSLHPSQKLREI